MWVGVSPGIYTTWEECLQHVKGYKGARYKSFATRAEAERALASPEDYQTPAAVRKAPSAPKALPENIDYNAIAVDAACSGNPGPMEYQGVYLVFNFLNFFCFDIGFSYFETVNFII